jgi:hypothetical protein
MFLAMLGEAQANLRDDQLNARKEAAKKGEQLPPEYGILHEGQRAIVKGLMRVPVLRKLVKNPDALLEMHEKGTLMSVFEEQMEQIDRLDERLLGLNDKVEDLMAAFKASMRGGPSASLQSQQSQANSRGSDGTLERVERLLLEMREMHEMRWESDPRRRHKASGRESSLTRSFKEINGPGEESRGESRNARPDDRKAPEATHTQGESRPGHSRRRDSSGERRDQHHRHGSREHPGRSTSSITKEHTYTRERAHNGSPVLASHKLRA